MKVCFPVVGSFLVLIYTIVATPSANHRLISVTQPDLANYSNTSSGVYKYTVSIVNAISPVHRNMESGSDQTPSLSDLLSFMKQSEVNRKNDMKAFDEKLRIERENDKNEFAKDMSSLTTTLTELVKTGVKDEIEIAVKPLEEKQNLLIDEQKAMLDEQSKLSQKVLELENKLEAAANGKETSEAAVSNMAEAPAPFESSSISKEQEDNQLMRNTIKSARKILGFSKITVNHIQQAVIEHELDPNDEANAKIWAICDFLYYEMKLPEDKIKDMKILRTFRPAKDPDSDRLYAEFADESSINQIHQHVKNLQPGTNIDIWVPPSLHERFRDFDNACYLIRKGPGNFKAKVRYGENDFILIKKSPSCHSWTSVIPENLSPIDPSPSSRPTQSSSPPIGRNNRSKNKGKERSPISSPNASKSVKIGSPEAAKKDADNAMELNRSQSSLN